MRGEEREQALAWYFQAIDEARQYAAAVEEGKPADVRSCCPQECDWDGWEERPIAHLYARGVVKAYDYFIAAEEKEMIEELKGDWVALWEESGEEFMGWIADRVGGASSSNDPDGVHIWIGEGNPEGGPTVFVEMDGGAPTGRVVACVTESSEGVEVDSPGRGLEMTFD